MHYIMQKSNKSYQSALSLKPNGIFLITAPCYPHTLTKFASNEKTLPKIAEKYIDFSTKKLEPF